MRVEIKRWPETLQALFREILLARVHGSARVVGMNTTQPQSAGSLERVVSPLPCSTGRIEQAKRFALMNYDKWNEVTGFPAPHTSYYYEIASIIEDAVEFGFGVAHGQSWKTIVRRIKRANAESNPIGGVE